jgi:transcription antitermination factor NusG
MIFYEIATRVWKFRGAGTQRDLLQRIVKEDYQTLGWIEALPPKEISFFQQLPPDLDFKSNPLLIDVYLEFLERIEEFEAECDAELQKIDSERRELEKERQAALKKALADQAERDKLDRVVSTKRAYEEAVKRSQETYEELRRGDVSMFDLDFRITSNTATDEIARLMSRLGRTTVIVSPGSWGSAFHTSERCEWLNKGRSRASKFSNLGNLLTIGVEDAINHYKKRPCHSCFVFWWSGEINPHPEFGPEDNDFEEIVEVFLGDPVTINKGGYKGIEGEVCDLMREDKDYVKVKIQSLGKDSELAVPVGLLDFPENIDELRQERALKEERRLEEKFKLETTQVRTLEELILQLENGLNEFTQHDLKNLLSGVENRLNGLALTTPDSLSLEYLLNRLNRGISQARARVPR